MFKLTTDVHSYRTRSASNQHYYDRCIWNKSYMNCGNENQFMQLRKKPEKKFRTSTGFEPVTCDQNPLKSWIFFRLLTQLHKLRSQLLCWNKLFRYKTNFLPEETKWCFVSSHQLSLRFSAELTKFSCHEADKYAEILLLIISPPFAENANYLKTPKVCLNYSCKFSSIEKIFLIIRHLRNEKGLGPS